MLLSHPKAKLTQFTLRTLVPAVLAASLLAGSAARADLTNFTGSNLLLMRGGDSANPQSTLGTGQVPAYLDQYSVNVSGGIATATYLGQYAVPTSTLTLPGITVNSHEGRLELSGNGQYIDFGGYKQPVGAAPRTTDGSGGVGYLKVGQVSGTGALVSADLNTGATNAQFIRGAYSNDGTQAWVASKNPNGGLQYISGLGTSPVTTTLQGTTDWRDLKVNGGQLYGGTGSSSVGTHGFYSIGTGTPIVPTPVNTLLGPNSDNSASGFSFATLPGGTAPINGISGANVVYTIGDPSGNNYIGKLYNDGAHGAPLASSNLVFAGGARLPLTGANAISGPEGLLAKVDPDNAAWVDLFIQNADGVYFAVDKSGTSSGSIASLAFTKIIGTSNLPLPAGGNFYGISSAPAVPEPSTLVLIGIASIGAIAAYRRRRS